MKTHQYHIRFVRVRLVTMKTVSGKKFKTFLAADQKILDPMTFVRLIDGDRYPIAN